MAAKNQFGKADEFMDEGDYDDEYGTSGEQQYYYDAAQGANAAMIEGSGGSEEYDDEDISDESGMLRQRHYMAQQLAAAKAS